LVIGDKIPDFDIYVLGIVKGLVIESQDYIGMGCKHLACTTLISGFLIIQSRCKLAEFSQSK
jgi:hypothetical protein